MIPESSDHVGESGISAVLLSSGLSQESLAQALSMDESTVASWERGERQPIQKSSEKAEAFFRSTK